VSTLANRLKQSKKVDWESILSQIVLYCQDATSTGGSIENINLEPVTMKTEYLLYPVIPLNQPVTLFTAGGKGKSLFADWFSVMVQFGLASDGNLPFLPIQTNVLYLDWESDKDTHRKYITAIKRGMEITTNDEIRYLRCEQPLHMIIDDIREKVFLNQIGLVIVDSQMAATANTGRGMGESQIAGEYYNDLRSLNCSTLTIDHITKQSMSIDDGAAEAPYGSVVKYNRSRSQFELRLPDDSDDSDIKEYGLIHRKFNLGRKQKPLGITVNFQNYDDELISIKFSSCEIKNNENLSKSLPVWERLYNILAAGTPLSVAELSERTSIKEDNIKTNLNRKTNQNGTRMFAKNNEDKWLLSYIA
jgi:hypothetical protein